LAVGINESAACDVDNAAGISLSTISANSNAESSLAISSTARNGIATVSAATAD
jgi:hypothetical protein